MQVSTLWKQHVEQHEASGLNDLRRQSILQIGMVMLVMAWLMMLGSIGYGGQPQGLVVALLLFTGAIGIIFLRREHFHIALTLFIATSLLALERVCGCDAVQCRLPAGGRNAGAGVV
jgi:hypothetical protein